MLTTSISMETVCCPQCNLRYAIDALWLSRQREGVQAEDEPYKSATFRCPKGHKWVYPDPPEDKREPLTKRLETLQGEVQHLKEENIRLRQEAEQSEAARVKAEDVAMDAAKVGDVPAADAA